MELQKKSPSKTPVIIINVSMLINSATVMFVTNPSRTKYTAPIKKTSAVITAAVIISRGNLSI